MSLRKGSNVWIEDKELAWIPAEVVDVAGNHAVIITDAGNKVDLSNSDRSDFNGCLNFSY